jgi:hypothetical protein
MWYCSVAATDDHGKAVRFVPPRPRPHGRPARYTISEWNATKRCACCGKVQLTNGTEGVHVGRRHRTSQTPYLTSSNYPKPTLTVCTYPELTSMVPTFLQPRYGVPTSGGRIYTLPS